ncbi:GNAT family N-acetyltransferase [Allosphingosinicella sp.]|jgi:putative acetyltransferase|uniref:GNAT family N-acetyltransferase n=1 Tax=Allosphingosinicella sp. TaxID=2823234 RepID=UPI002EDC595C
MLIRDETAGDRAAVREIVSAAFGRQDEAVLVGRLRESGDAEIALVAELDGAILGHVMLSRMAAPFRALGLGPVAVAPERQREGIGSALVRESLERARSGGWEGVFVVGDPAYYRRFGFRPESARAFDSVYSGPHLMALGLAGPLPAGGGRIDYPPAFARLG